MNPLINNWFNRHLLKRKLIESGESRISITQIVGFVLAVVGLLYLFIRFMRLFSGRELKMSGTEIAVSFFIIMLGFAMAFPSLLRDQNKGVSTLRIVVFMITNVICLLFLKIGWEAENLTSIGVDQYWVAIIAFVFGAKAVQSFFESKMAVPRRDPQDDSISQVEVSGAELAKLAINQNQKELKEKFPNICAFSDAVDDMSLKESHVVTIYVSDENIEGIPESLDVDMQDGSVRIINTEIIDNVGAGEIQWDQKDYIQTADSTFKGSICCMARTFGGKQVLVSSGHVYTNGNLEDHRGWLATARMQDVRLNGVIPIGKWAFQQITPVQDIAFIELNDQIEDIRVKSFADSGGYFDTSDESVKREEVILLSNVEGERNGYILDHRMAWPVNYADNIQHKSNIINIGSTRDRSTSKTLSRRGDSGGVAIHKNSGRLVGIILGGNDRFTWVLPIRETLENNNLTLI